MNVQNENLLFTSACSLFHRTLLKLGEGTSFSVEPQTLEAKELLEEWLEENMSSMMFDRWNKRLFSPVMNLYAHGRKRSPEAAFHGNEDRNTGFLIKDECFCSLLDFCVSLYGNGEKIGKEIERYRRNNFAAMFAVERYLFVAELWKMDIRQSCNCVLMQFPELECVAMGRYPREAFPDDGWVKEMLPANMYLFRMQE